jgi:hypothetical protein
MTENTTLLDMESMMNETLDTVENVAEFANPPAGEYRLKVISAKPGKASAKGTPTMQITYAVVETKATASGEQPVPDGTMFSERFQWTEQGKPFFKARIKSIMGVDDVSGVTLGDMLASAVSAEFDARITIKKDPKKVDGVVVPGEFYENIQIRVVR